MPSKMWGCEVQGVHLKIVFIYLMCECSAEWSGAFSCSSGQLLGCEHQINPELPGECDCWWGKGEGTQLQVGAGVIVDLGF